MLHLYEGDTFDILPQLEKESIDLVFTSPPYNVGKEYDLNLSEDEYIQWSKDWMKLIPPLLKESGIFVLNIDDKVTKVERSTRIPQLWLYAVDELGLHYIEMYIWNKGKMLPIRSNYRATNVYEPCVAPDTLIYTSQGLKRIKYISVGDYVLSHTGNYRRVTNTMTRRTSNLLSVSVTGFPNPLEITHNHPVLAVINHHCSKYKSHTCRPSCTFNCNDIVDTQSLRWVPIGELSVGDYLTIPVIHHEVVNSSLRQPFIHLNNRFSYHKIRSIIPLKKEVTVHNLEVEDDHSYVTLGGIVHNCLWFSKSLNFRFNRDDVRRPYNPISVKRMEYPIKKRWARDPNNPVREYKEWEPNPKGALPKNIIDIGSEYGNKVHPAVFPVKLAEWFIKAATSEGDTVLDPFIGSGTTMVAAATLNRNCIGVEIEPRYIDISINRLKELNYDVQVNR